MAIKGYFDAIRFIFAGWSFPRDPETNLMKGTLDDVKADYARLGERLGCPLLPPETAIDEFGYDRLKTNELDAALAAFRYNTELYPRSANVWDSLGDALERAGRKDEALANCRKAVSLAEANGDPNIEVFRKHVARLAGVAKRDAH